MRRRTFTAMLAGLACAIAVSGPLFAQATAPGAMLNARATTATAAQMHQSPKVTAPKNELHATAAEPAMTKIATADVLDPSSPVFIGTGDGGNGSWTRP